MSRNVVSRILERVRKELSHTMNGQVLSKLKGEGFDFAELMPYMEGMDAKKIYWNSMAKGSDLQIKTFFEEKEVTVVVALLMSGSLCFGEPVQKWEKVLECAAFVGYDALRSGNRFQGFLWSEKKTFVTAPSTAFKSVEKFLHEVPIDALLYQKTDPKKALEALFQKVHKKSLLIIISDFLEVYDLRKLAKRDAVVCIVVRDRFEASPHMLGEVVLQDPETGAEAELFFDAKTAKAYGDAYKKHDKALVRSFRRAGVKHFFLYTDQPVAAAF